MASLVLKRRTGWMVRTGVFRWPEGRKLPTGVEKKRQLSVPSTPRSSSGSSWLHDCFDSLVRESLTQV